MSEICMKCGNLRDNQGYCPNCDDYIEPTHLTYEQETLLLSGEW